MSLVLLLTPSDESVLDLFIALKHVVSHDTDIVDALWTQSEGKPHGNWGWQWN